MSYVLLIFMGAACRTLFPTRRILNQTWLPTKLSYFDLGLNWQQGGVISFTDRFIPLLTFAPSLAGISNFIPSFDDTFRLASSPPEENNIWLIKKTSQQRDVYLNKHCRSPMSTSENVRVYVFFGYVRNFYR